MTPLPDGSGVTDGHARAAGHDGLVVRVELSAHVLETACSTSCASATRGGRSAATAARADGTASASLEPAGIPSTARFPNTLPTFLIAGYQQLGSPPNTATDFGTSVTQIADTLTWLKGRHTSQDRRGPALGAPQRHPAAVADRDRSRSATCSRICRAIANTGTPLASFLLGQVQQFSIDLQQDQIRNRAHFQEYFVQDDWRVSDRVTVNAGLRYTLNFPSTEENNQAAVFNLDTQQLEYLGRNGQPRAARRLHKDNFGPRLGVGRARHRQDRRAHGYGLVWIEMAGHHDAVHDAGRFRSCRRCRSARSTTSCPAFMLAHGPRSSRFR